MYIHRRIENAILPFLNRKEAIAIVGPRQAGKTTLMRFLQKHLSKTNKKTHFLRLKIETICHYLTKALKISKTILIHLIISSSTNSNMQKTADKN